MVHSRARLLVALATCCLLAPAAASANAVFVGLSRLDDFVFPGAEFGLFIELELTATGVTDVAVTAGTLSVPLALTPDGVWEEDIDLTFTNLGDLQAKLSGLWTIQITGGANASTSTFTLNANGLVDSDFFATATSLSPPNGATGVSANTSLSWNDPTDTATPFVLALFADGGMVQQDAVSLEGTILGGLSATSWQPPLALPNGLVEWGVFYAKDPLLTSSLVGNISVTPGSGNISWGTHPFAPEPWPPSKPFLILGSDSIVQITVPEPAALFQSGMALASLGALGWLKSRSRTL